MKNSPLPPYAVPRDEGSGLWIGKMGERRERCQVGMVQALVPIETECRKPGEELCPSCVLQMLLPVCHLFFILLCTSDG